MYSRLSLGVDLRRVVVLATAPVLGRVVPVHDRIVDAELEALFAAFLGQRLEQVTCRTAWRRQRRIRYGGVEQAESVVVLGGDHDVLARRHPWPIRTHSAASYFTGLN